MKKTIIALMALAGVAAAQTTITSTWVDLPNTVENFYSGDYVFTFMLDDTFTLADSGSVLGVYYGKNATADAGACGIVLGGTDGALTLSVGRGNTSKAPSNAVVEVDTTFTFNTSYDSGNGNPNKITFANTIETGVLYTLSVTGGNHNMVATLTWDGQTGTPESLAYSGNMVEGNKNQFMNYAKNNGIAVVSVPEPTTATLSLLALAGLAARRRRK